MCVGMPQSLAKNTILPSSQVQGLLWTSLTSAIELTVTCDAEDLNFLAVSV